MQKTYLWRWLTVVATLILIGLSYFFGHKILFSPCDAIESLVGNDPCFTNAFKSISKPLFFSSVALLIISPFLFFFSDKFFIKWFRFALVWFFLAIVFVAFTPEQHNFMSLNPDKETVSIWMSALFVIISLGMFIREWATAKK